MAAAAADAAGDRAVMQIPAGTRVTVRARTQQGPGPRASVESALDEPPKPPPAVAADRAGDPRSFQYTMEPLDEGQDAAVHAVRHRRHPQPRADPACRWPPLDDQPPELAVQLARHRHGDHAAGHAAGRRQRDRRLRHRPGLVRVRGRPGASRPSSRSPRRRATPTELAHRARPRRPRRWGSSRAESCWSCVKAADRCDLARAAQRRHQRALAAWTWSRPEQLRAMLEARELVAAAAVRGHHPGSDRDPRLAGADRVRRAPPGRAEKPPSRQSRPRGPSPAKKPDAASRSLGRSGWPSSSGRSQVQRALQNCRKNARETAGRGRGVRRHPRGAGQQPHRHRGAEAAACKAGIAEPLRQIADEMFPELDRRLDRLRKTV